MPSHFVAHWHSVSDILLSDEQTSCKSWNCFEVGWVGLLSVESLRIVKTKVYQEILSKPLYSQVSSTMLSWSHFMLKRIQISNCIGLEIHIFGNFLQTVRRLLLQTCSQSRLRRWGETLGWPSRTWLSSQRCSPSSNLALNIQRYVIAMYSTVNWCLKDRSMFEALHATCRAMQSRLVELIDQVCFFKSITLLCFISHPTPGGGW